MREENLTEHEKKNKKRQSKIDEDSSLLAPYDSDDPCNKGSNDWDTRDSAYPRSRRFGSQTTPGGQDYEHYIKQKAGTS